MFYPGTVVIGENFTGSSEAGCPPPTGPPALSRYKKKECLRVVLLKGNVHNVTEFGACTSGKPVSTEFVDSPVAIQEARKAGFQPDPDGENGMTFGRSRDKLAKGKESWTVHTVSDFDRAKAVMRGWCVDGKTGKFVTRLSGSN